MLQCSNCAGTGKCQTCKGSGFSGYFLIPCPKSAMPCRRCDGTGCCKACEGAGEIPEIEYRFVPFIYVLASLQIPTSIMAAAFSGASWRRIDIPRTIRQRAHEAQQGWVIWRLRSHFRHEKGRCPLFGSITGYNWHWSAEDSILFDVRGHIVEHVRRSFTPPAGSLTVKNKDVAVTSDGTLKFRPYVRLT